MSGRAGAGPDVVIAGAGVAGASLAIWLGRAGLEVELYDRRVFPQDKACAEGIMPAGVAVLERLGLAAAVGGQPFRGVRYHGWGQAVEQPFLAVSGSSGTPGVPAFGLGQRRLRLDAALVEAARALPTVRVIEGARVEGAIVESGRVRGLLVDGAARRARLTVGADGPRSTLRRRLGLERPARAGAGRIGVRRHFRLAPGVRTPDFVEIHLGDDHEIYVTPLPDGEVAVASLADESTGDRGLDATVTRWIGMHRPLAALLEGATPAGPLAGRAPLAGGARVGVLPGLALVGDAAGFVDPVTGSGMAQALLSAELLAGHLLRRAAGAPRFDPSDDVLESFDRARRALLRDCVLLSRLVLGLVRRPAVARHAITMMRACPPLLGHLVGVAAAGRPLVPL